MKEKKEIICTDCIPKNEYINTGLKNENKSSDNNATKIINNKSDEKIETVSKPDNKVMNKKEVQNELKNSSKTTSNKETKATTKKNNDDKNNLVIGINDKKKEMFIPSFCRNYNTLVLGLKGTGKTTKLLPFMAEQDFKNKNCGVTIISTKHDIIYSLYSLAKNYKRDIKILKPSVNYEIANNLLWQNEYNYDYIKEHLINYKEAIKKKQIVLIDMEVLKYKNDGLRAVAMLLLQLELDMQETDETQRQHHYLYIDDAEYYLQSLDRILTFSDDYNIGVTLFMQTRAQMKHTTKDYTSMIDSNVRNTLLCNVLSKEDKEYYDKKINDVQFINNNSCRNYDSLIYEIADINNRRKYGVVNYASVEHTPIDTLISKSKKNRTKLLEKQVIEAKKYILKRSREISDLEESDTEEAKSVDKLTKQLIKEVPPELLVNKDMNEPVPVNIDDIDKDMNVDGNEEIKNKVKMDKKNLKQIEADSNQKIKEIIKLKNKEAKRKVSSQIFNNINSHITYCDNNFDFHFDE